MSATAATQKKSTFRKIIYLLPVIVLLFAPYFMVLGTQTTKTEIDTQKTADMLHAVLQANRVVYAKYIINRLTRDDHVIQASEHWVDDKTLPLPSQMLELSSAELASGDTEFSYRLLSLWAINKANFPQHDKEREGLIYILKNPGKNYYTTLEEGGKKYFIAVYPDTAISSVCVECHNKHEDSPKRDFQTGDLMGGLVLRIPQG